MGRRIRKYKRKSKELRKNNKMWAEGAREELLKPHVGPYADALAKGWRSERDYLQKVCNEYNAKISWRLKDNEEPELPLPAYDPLAAPVEETVTEEERQERHARHEELEKRIRRWLKYRARSLRTRGTSASALRNSPYGPLLAKLSGLVKPPKARQAYQQYMSEKTEEIGTEVNESWKLHSVNSDGSANTKAPNASFRSQVARRLFEALSPEEKAGYQSRATERAKVAKEEFLTAMANGPSRSPQARQDCIDNFGKFMAPILHGIQEYTGLQGFIILGGPMPRFGGDVGVVHLSVGSNLAPLPTPFPAWDGAHWNREIVGSYTNYLRTAYTDQDCAEAALPVDSALGGAKYKIGGSDSESDSDDESDSSESDDTSSSDSDDSDAGARKKKKKASAKGTGKEVVGVKRKAKDVGKGAVSAKKPRTKAKAKPKSPEETEEERAEREQAEKAEKEREEDMDRRRQNERERQARIEANNKLLADLGLKQALSMEAMGIAPKQKPVRKPHAKPAATGDPPRRSARNKGTNDGEGGTEEPMDVDDGNGGGEEDVGGGEGEEVGGDADRDGDGDGDGDGDRDVMMTPPASNIVHATGSPLPTNGALTTTATASSSASTVVASAGTPPPPDGAPTTTTTTSSSTSTVVASAGTPAAPDGAPTAMATTPPSTNTVLVTGTPAPSNSALTTTRSTSSPTSTLVATAASPVATNSAPSPTTTTSTSPSTNVLSVTTTHHPRPRPRFAGKGTGAVEPGTSSGGD
ncbi:hypothetical protein B0H14DRAFT_3636093 [Mycena olivaceomarginata]|nr:hypothetical protein B0H14DRAFT_3636093 [Mycena olivaceomarginata]